MSRYAWIRGRAAEKLGEYKGGLAVKALVSALKDKGWGVASNATESLGKIGESAVESLVASLKDSDW
jgi:HEAT repeat protein